ncbi:hypothetical protein EDD22DRAFT_240496 [Suillus occidentalis]|nr:hypothetical protein EDD22DRAFT_240496 [Suillus occidentalis]
MVISSGLHHNHAFEYKLAISVDHVRLRQACESTVASFGIFGTTFLLASGKCFQADGRLLGDSEDHGRMSDLSRSASRFEDGSPSKLTSGVVLRMVGDRVANSGAVFSDHEETALALARESQVLAAQEAKIPALTTGAKINIGRHMHCTMAHAFGTIRNTFPCLRVFLGLNLSGAFDAVQLGTSNAFTMMPLLPPICHYRGSHLRLKRQQTRLRCLLSNSQCIHPDNCQLLCTKSSHGTSRPRQKLPISYRRTSYGGSLLRV